MSDSENSENTDDKITDTVDDIMGFVRQQRDELKLKMHLAGKDAQDEWDKLETKTKELESRVEPLTGAVKEAVETAGEQSKKVAGAALDLAAKELKENYKKLRGMLD